jgi:putative PIN family toxin of toxin-antitoxin system
MLPLRLVLDTNSVVSAAFKRGSLQQATFTLAVTKPARLYVTTQILDEYSEVLARPWLGISKGTRLQMLQLIKNRSYLVTPTRRIEVCSDPDDNIFLECADAARADYLITGNLKHFPTFWKSTKIVTAREFMDVVAPHLMG